MGAERPAEQHEFFRYVSGAGGDYKAALEAAQAAVPPGYSVVAVRTFKDGLVPEIPVDLDAVVQPIGR